YAAGPEAARLGATAMLDVSDGLAQDLGHVCRAGGVDIDLDSIALNPPPELVAALRALDVAPDRAVEAARDLMITGGVDHALAATFPETTSLPPHWYYLGTVVDRQHRSGEETGNQVPRVGKPRVSGGHNKCNPLHPCRKCSHRCDSTGAHAPDTGSRYRPR